MELVGRKINVESQWVLLSDAKKSNQVDGLAKHIFFEIQTVSLAFLRLVVIRKSTNCPLERTI